MHRIYSFIILALCSLQAVTARPTKTQPRSWPDIGLPSILHGLSGSSLQALGAAFADCSSYDLSQAELPTAPTPLPKPTGTLAHVAIGRGVQNYTCDLSNSTAVPVPVGALATLYNATCVAATSSSFLSFLPNLAYALRLKTLPAFASEGVTGDTSFVHQSLLSTLLSQFTSSSPQEFVVNTANSLMSGHHFFTDATTPRFDLNTDNGQLGTVTVSKVGVSDPPSDASPGSVAWLYLPKSTSYTANPQAYSAVYRVNTVGGAAPATCKEAGKSHFRRAYAAEYWFYK